MKVRKVSILILALITSWPGYARGGIGALGVMGDSLSDEYFDEGFAYATNWTVQLVDFRGINLGPTAAQAGTGDWGEPRRTGYEFNWARYGDTTATLLNPDFQHTGLAAQVVPFGITHAVLEIGANDFNPFSPSFLTSEYSKMYNGSLSAAQIQSYVSQTLANLETALQTVRVTGVKMVLVNVLDTGMPPTSRLLFSNGTKRDQVAAVIQTVNNGIALLGQKYQVPVVDFFAMEKAILGQNTSLKSTLKLGNVTINLTQSDSNPTSSPNRTAGFVDDGFHPHSTFQGLICNLILQAFNQAYNTGVPLFSEREILNNAGIAYGGSDTLPAQIAAYSNYIIMPSPPRLAVSGTDITVSYVSSSNQLYTFETRSDLGTGSWLAFTNHVAGTGGTVTVTNFGAASQPRHFYRVKVE